MPETQGFPVTCPSCGAQFHTPIHSIIDVSANPRLRQAFLSNQINMAVCPNCGQGGLLEVPLVYHDAGAEFLAVYFPSQLNLPEIERQKMIGEMTQTLMRSLPVDQRKGYFLNPRQFVNRQNLVDAVLGTMGVSQEELDRQRRKAKLLEQLRVFAEDRKGLEMMIKGKDAEFDYEFFMILSSMMEQSEAMGDEKALYQMTRLRENLLEVTTFGKRIGKQEAAVKSLADVKDPDEFFEKMLAADLDEVDAMAVAARPALDYEFFQRLTERIEASSDAEKKRLVQLREHILKLTEKLDASSQAEIQAASELLQDLLQSPSPRSEVRERMAEVDDLFLRLLVMNMEEAEKQGATDVLERMKMIYEEVMDLVESSFPREVQLVNELLRAPYPDGTRAILHQRQAEITPAVIELMDSLVAEMTERGDETSKATAKRLRDIRAQAMLVV